MNQISVMTRKATCARVFRVAAVLLLLLGAVDLAFPQICGEDNGPVLSQSQSRTSSGSDPRSDSSQQQEGRDEDCFCCCSHILSVEPTAPLQALVPSNESPLPNPDRVTASPFDSPFRPPRLA